MTGSFMNGNVTTREVCALIKLRDGKGLGVSNSWMCTGLQFRI